MPSLFSKGHFGQIETSNRIVMAPLTRSRADSFGVPASFAADYYAQRATAGLIVTEATQVSFEGMGYARTPGLHTEPQIEAWKKITAAVHARGGKIVSQLWHVGRIAHKANRGVDADVVAPSAIAAPGEIYTDVKGMVAYDVPRALETREIGRIAKEYAAAAKAAISAGFDGVEVHSANGYLLHQFLSTNVNQRTDRYGGTIENRASAPLEIIRAVIGAAGAGRVGVRVSPGNGFNGIEESDVEPLYTYYLGELDKLGLAYLHVMRSSPDATRIDPVTFARGIFKGPLIAAGGYDRDEAGTLLSSGGADAVAFGKAYIANPDLVARLLAEAPLNTPDEATFYAPGPKGYTDYPAMPVAGTAP